jgi:hypothetical protein
MLPLHIQLGHSDFKNFTEACSSSGESQTSVPTCVMANDLFARSPRAPLRPIRFRRKKSLRMSIHALGLPGLSIRQLDYATY